MGDPTLHWAPFEIREPHLDRDGNGAPATELGGRVGLGFRLQFACASSRQRRCVAVQMPVWSMLGSLPMRVGGTAVGLARATRVRLGARGMGSCAAMAGDKQNAGRGALIVLEGLDRSGKSSQCAQLASYLETQGVAVEAWRFPDRTTAMGQMISSYLSCQTDLDDAAIHLLFSANRWEKRSRMESKLKAGTTLVVDRYSYSGVAFSAAKGLDLDWCKAPEVGLPAPDLVLYLDISAEVAAARGGYGGERYEKIEFQKKVEEIFKSLKDTAWQNVDATRSIDSIQSVIREESVKVIEECLSGRGLMQMWSSDSRKEMLQ